MHSRVYPESSWTKRYAPTLPSPARGREISEVPVGGFCSARLPTGDRRAERNAFTRSSHPRFNAILRPDMKTPHPDSAPRGRKRARHANRSFAVACALVASLTLAFLIWIWLRIDGVHVSEAIDNFG